MNYELKKSLFPNLCFVITNFTLVHRLNNVHVHPIVPVLP